MRRNIRNPGSVLGTLPPRGASSVLAEAGSLLSRAVSPPAAAQWTHSTGFERRTTVPPMEMNVSNSSLVLRRLWVIIGWLGIAAVIYVSLIPRPPQLGIAHGNRIGHVFVYALLILWFAQIAVVPGQRLRYAGGLIALAVGLEFAQLATYYRTFSYWDMAGGALGVIVGWVLAPPRLPNLLSIAERIAARRVGVPMQ